MAKINFMDRDNVLREFELKEELVTVGREATNKLVVADPSVSRQHARIEKREDGYYLIDNNSSNGTYINGKRISQQKINHKDKVNFGSATVVFEDEEQVAATFILPRPEIPEPSRAPNVNERVTDAVDAAEEPSTVDDDRPLPPPPPLLTSTPVIPHPAAAAAPAPPKPQQAAPPSPPPAPESVASKEPATPIGVLCPNCRKVVESGARFCGFCGSPLATAPKPAPAAPPAAAPAPSKPAAPAPAPPKPAAAAPAPPRPAAPAPVPPKPAEAVSQIPSFGVQETDRNYAGFGVRLVAYLIDALILTFIGLIISIPAILLFVLPMLRQQEPSPFAMVVLFACELAGAVVGLAYSVYFVGAKGATPGKKMMKLKVMMQDGQYPIGYAKAFLRVIGYMISGLICYIGFLMIAFDKEQHRGLHDKIAGTVVVKES